MPRYGVRPLGSLLSPGAPLSCREPGLGGLAFLSNEIIAEHVLALLDARALGRLGRASRACYVLAHSPELWRALVIEHHGDGFVYERSWKDT